MNEPLRADQQEKFRHLLMKAIDQELSGEEESEFRYFVERYPECRKEWQDFKKLREVTQAMKFKNPPQEIWDSYWLSVYHRLERGLAWILFSIGAIILLTYGGYKAIEGIISDPQLPGLLKAAILLVLAGTVILLVSIIREKLFVRKKDPYKEVQR